MRDLSMFGTAAHPLHPSGLLNIVVCPWRAVMELLHDAEGEGGQAADTGSAMHRAAAAMHRGEELAACLKAMREDSAKYPRADLQDAADMFLKYATDPRNKSSSFPLVEAPIAFDIEALDPSQPPISVIGTCDQVREEGGRLTMWDIKTSKKDPMEILQQSTFQIAAYCIGASVKLGRQVNPGGIIMPRRYRADVATSPVFYHCAWAFSDIAQILLSVRHAVDRIRAGQVWHVPNKDCCWCPARSPDTCLPRLQKEILLAPVPVP